ncbi:MAG TPA: hypothetical protein VGQ83_27630 [Polyangia bacterium]|jgi:hypothetical protein
MIDDDDSGLEPRLDESDGAGEPDGLELDERQIEEMRGIFATSLPQYLDPLEELCHQLLGGGGAEVHASFLAAAGSLREAAEKMSFAAVSDNLRRLEEAVAQLPLVGGAAVDRDGREAVLELILDLRQISEDLGAAHDAVKGRPLVERLAGMPGASETAARLARAGLVLDAQLEGARPDEIAAVSGLGRDQVARVLAWLRGEPPEPASEPAAAPAAVPVAAFAPAPTGDRDAGVPDEEDRLAGEVAALAAATERLGARLDEVRVDAARARARVGALRDERARLGAELERVRHAGTELDRWLAESTGLRAQLLAQRDLYTAARRDAEHRLSRRRQQLEDLTQALHRQREELGSSRAALEELDAMVRGIRARLGRERITK